ncbi:MAG: hypothetical protein PHF60_05060 [Candidatus ainarchaeum sp.]|nr:hypothetical protein [Candidatus ainarchaeum sp.]
MIRKLSAQPAPDLGKTPVRAPSMPLVRRSAMSVAPLTEPRFDSLSPADVLKLGYPQLEDACKKLAREDGRLKDPIDQLYVVRKLFTRIAFSNDVRTAIKDGTTTIKKLFDGEVEQLRRTEWEIHSAAI